MHGSAWMAIIRQIPLERQSQFNLVTHSGTEIAIQCILRTEDEFVAFKGRLAGSQDAGRVFFVPYQNIDFIGSTQPIKESEFEDLFGSMVLPGISAPLHPIAHEAPPTVVETVAQVTTNGTAKQDSGPRPAIRSEILERFRNNRPSSASTLPNVRPTQP